MLILLTNIALALQVKVAVIDTGNPKIPHSKVCGVYNFSSETKEDTHGHATNVSYLIAKHAKASHCQIYIKFFAPRLELEDEDTTLTANIASLKKAIELKVHIINLSLTGVHYSKKECSLVKKALDKGITVVASAGNAGVDIRVKKYYPAMCDKRVTVVGCSDTKIFNYGKLDRKEKCLLQGVPIMSGTSQAAAIATGKLIEKKYKKLLDEQNKR